MRYLKKRHIDPANYDARHERSNEISSHRVKRCAVCTFDFPESDMVVEDWLEKCPMCADTYTADYYADEEANVSEVKQLSAERLMMPPQFSTRALTEPHAAAVTSIVDANSLPISPQNPIRLKNGSSAVSVTLAGQYFTSGITFTYPTGVTNHSAPVITTTSITLSLDGGATIVGGLYDLILNDGVSTYGHQFAKVFQLA